MRNVVLDCELFLLLPSLRWWMWSSYRRHWDVSGFVRLFYILLKNKIFHIFGGHILDFLPIISRFSWIYRTFSVKNLFFVKIKNKRTKPDTSLTKNEAWGQSQSPATIHSHQSVLPSLFAKRKRWEWTDCHDEIWSGIRPGYTSLHYMANSIPIIGQCTA